jgi:lipid-A-disaccharide synthase
MVNIIAGKTIAPELIQGDVNPEKITSTVLRIIRDPSTLKEMRRELARVREKIGNPGASLRAARITNELIQSRYNNG